MTIPFFVLHPLISDGAKVSADPATDDNSSSVVSAQLLTAFALPVPAQLWQVFALPEPE